MISFHDIARLFSFNSHHGYCIEIEFSVTGYPEYQSCWMGKMPDKRNKGQELYWYGLIPDGSEAYNYDSFQDFSCSSVFRGKSLKEIWDSVEILSIDGCDPEDGIQAYL